LLVRRANSKLGKGKKKLKMKATGLPLNGTRHKRYHSNLTPPEKKKKGFTVHKWTGTGKTPEGVVLTDVDKSPCQRTRTHGKLDRET